MSEDTTSIDYEKLAEALAPKLAPATATPAPVVSSGGETGDAEAFGDALRRQLEPLPEAGHAAERTLGVGMAGEAVHELAKLLEACGVETYLHHGGNPRHIFTQELLQQVRGLIGDPRGFVTKIDGDVWRALRARAGAQAAA